MKKILFVMVALFAMLISSCSNDNNDNSTDGKNSGLIVNVCTQRMYDDFNLDIKKYIDNYKNRSSIGVFCFIYNESGVLVEKQIATERSTDDIILQFENLKKGIYTVVAIETLVDTYSENSKYWDFYQIDNLRTLQIVQSTNEVYTTGVLGVSTSKITLYNNKTMTITPMPIGALIDVNFYNFSESDFVNVGFGTDNRISSYYLDPSLDRNERFEMNTVSNGYFRLRMKQKTTEENPINAYRYILEPYINYYYCGQYEQNVNKDAWTYMNKQAKYIEIEDGKTYYGSVIFGGDYFYFMAQLSENETERLDWEKEILAKVNTLALPNIYTTWKGSVAAVQSFMKGYKMTCGKEGKAIKQDDNSYLLIYDGKDKEFLISYSFLKETTGLFRGDIYYKKTEVKLEDLKSSLNKSYKLLGEESSFYMYSSLDEKTIVALFFSDNDLYDVAFFDVDFLMSDSASKRSIRQSINKIKIRPLNRILH